MKLHALVVGLVLACSLLVGSANARGVYVAYGSYYNPCCDPCYAPAPVVVYPSATVVRARYRPVWGGPVWGGPVYRARPVGVRVGYSPYWW
ncbi:MAG: hypothetical protein IT425_00990 [Pirellulales bacterium]|nr:hypothetical protein [Pirellulales bacterium]